MHIESVDDNLEVNLKKVLGNQVVCENQGPLIGFTF
jgi:hypothetical protein